MGSNNEFKIVTGEKDDTVLVLLLGSIRAQEIPELETMVSFLVEKSQPSVILSFRDITQFLPGAYGAFTRMQSTLRKAGKLIAVCSFRPEIKGALLQAGVLRDSEIFNNIPDAWNALRNRIKDLPVVPMKKAA